MFKVATPAFLALPNAENKRVLVEGKVRLAEPGKCEIDFEHIAGLVPGTDLTLFAEVRGKFFQQAAVVTNEAYDIGKTTVSFDLVGEPVSAEQRGSFRTSAVMLSVPIGIERLTSCTLADVSPEGVGVLTSTPLTVGSMVSVTLSVEGFSVSEKMKVQGLKVLPSGKMRFGLYVPGKTTASRRTLERLASHLQRMQLRRLSGAA